jgi:hypothetical protein
MLFSGCPQAAARLCQDMEETEAACCAERGGGGGGGGNEGGTYHGSHEACRCCVAHTATGMKQMDGIQPTPNHNL